MSLRFEWIEADHGVWCYLTEFHSEDDDLPPLAIVTRQFESANLEATYIASLPTSDPKFDAFGKSFTPLKEAKEWCESRVKSVA